MSAGIAIYLLLCFPFAKSIQHLSVAQLHGAFTDRPVERFAFGSCNKQRKPQPLWKDIVDSKPQFWLWLGDNIYLDRRTKEHPAWHFPGESYAKQEYAVQMNHSDYQYFLASDIPITGIWDDHDFGVNNAGKEFTGRDITKKLMLEFLGIPEGHDVYRREGTYVHHTLGPSGRRTTVILLDTRTFRDPLGSNGDMLGDQQWEWLASILASSTSQVHIIGSTIQVLQDLGPFLRPYDHPESWAAFPEERCRLFDLLKKHRIPGVIFLSGDVHHADFNSRPRMCETLVDSCGIGYDIFEMTSSGMTHTFRDEGLKAALPAYDYLLPGNLSQPWHFPRPFNRPRFFGFNYGLIDIAWGDTMNATTVTLRVLTENNIVVMERELRGEQLLPVTTSARPEQDELWDTLMTHHLRNEQELLAVCMGEQSLPLLPRHRLRLLAVLIAIAYIPSRVLLSKPPLSTTICALGGMVLLLRLAFRVALGSKGSQYRYLSWQRKIA